MKCASRKALIRQVLIREANESHARVIADLQIESWRATYNGILPEAYLKAGIVIDRHAYWRNALRAPSPGDFVLLAVHDDTLLAFTAVLMGHEPDCDVLIDNLHVHPQYHRLGLGRRLMSAVADRSIATGARSMCLWVFDENRSALAFYRRLGGVADRHGFDDFAGGGAAHTRLIWRDLSALGSAR